MDTIAAIATPRGSGGIAIVRLSGPDSKKILSSSFLPQRADFENFHPWKLHHGKILDSQSEPLDDVLAVFMPGPATFTGEDAAEVHCHGGWLIAEAILENFLRQGARQAGPGEFTRRAFLNDRMDLSQAEAVAELIAAPTRKAVRYCLHRLDGAMRQKIESLRETIEDIRLRTVIALDFPDEEIDEFRDGEILESLEHAIYEINLLLANHARTRAVRDGASVVLAGEVNAGKSSLLNALCGKERALVCAAPGTTRDYIEERLNLDGIAVRLFDVAGLRDESEADPTERLGMKKSRELMETADAVIIVLDGEKMASAPSDALMQGEMARLFDAVSGKRRLVVWNKSDLAPARGAPSGIDERFFCEVSCKSGQNLEKLCSMLAALLQEVGMDAEGSELSPNARQALLLEEARVALDDFRLGAMNGAPLDARIGHLEDAVAALGQIIGLNSPEEMLDRIFSTFCIGK